MTLQDTDRLLTKFVLRDKYNLSASELETMSIEAAVRRNEIEQWPQPFRVKLILSPYTIEDGYKCYVVEVRTKDET